MTVDHGVDVTGTRGWMFRLRDDHRRRRRKLPLR